ncbi:MAG: hypothetical protein MUE30_10705 [Spirosomaceae bacterium]|nr:hypothetical protein [Spirosomataceae bacterium]
MVLVVEKIPRKIPEKQLLKALVYEEWGDKVVYYKGYEEVLRGEINLESVMSCSDIQGVLVAILTYTIASKINRKKYLLATNEVGLHLKRKNNLGNDLVIYEREKVKTLRGKYFNVPPKIAKRAQGPIEARTGKILCDRCLGPPHPASRTGGVSPADFEGVCSQAEGADAIRVRTH